MSASTKLVARYSVYRGREHVGTLLVQENGKIRAQDHLGRGLGIFDKAAKAQTAIHDAWCRQEVSQ